MSYKISTIHKLHNSKYQFTLIIRCLFIYIMYNSKQQQLNKKMSFLGLRRKRKNWILVLLYTIFHIIFLFIVVQRKLSNFSAISWREQVNFQWDDDEVRFVLDQHADLDFYSASSLIDMSLHSDTLFWFWANQSLLILLIAACLAEKQQIPIL
jgi:uncharacterized membrane protein